MSWRHIVALTAVVIVAVLARAPGMGARGLFYDDAWFALPARVGLGTALRMTVTTPGFTLIERFWIQVGPHSDTWAQLLPFLLGVTGVILVFVLGFVLRFNPWIAISMAAVVAVSPAAIEDSVRVKEYTADLVLAATLLILAELARRSRECRVLFVLVVASCISVALSASTIPIVVGVWAALIASSYVDGDRTNAVLRGGLVSLVLVVAMGVFEVLHVPPSLGGFWAEDNRLIGGPWTWIHLRETVGFSGAGLLRGLFATPLPVTTGLGIPYSDGTLYASLAGTAGVVALGAWLSWPALAAVRRRDATAHDLRLLPSVLSMGCAIAGFLLGVTPIGTGRTDLVLYPALLVLGASGVQRGVMYLRRISSPRLLRAVLLPLVVIGVTVGLGVAWRSRAWYPSQDLRTLDRKIQEVAKPTDALVITNRNSYTWAFDELSKNMTVHFSRTSTAASTIGFWVTVPGAQVFTERPPPTGTPLPSISRLSPRIKRLWLVGTTNEVYTPSSYHLTDAAGARPIDPRSPTWLSAQGWRPTTIMLRADGVYARLYIRP